jgi:AbrB family looped-hinge helix DNA binding protein
MAIARSKITAQGRISIPAEVRKKLGVGPGSILEWEERENEFVVRRAGRHTAAEIHAALFGATTPTPRVTVKEGIRKYVRRKHARR